MKKAVFSLALLFSIPFHLKAMEKVKPSGDSALMQEYEKSLGDYACNETPNDITVKFSEGLNKPVYSNTPEDHAVKMRQLRAFSAELSKSGHLLPNALSSFKATLNETSSYISDTKVRDNLAIKIDSLTQDLEIINSAVRIGESFVRAHPNRTEKVPLDNYQTLLKAYQNEIKIAEELLAHQIAYTLFRKASNAKQIEQIKKNLNSQHQKP